MIKQEIEEFYKKNNCSTVNMANDNLPMYSEFLKLKIDSKLLNLWQKEHLDQLLKSIKETGEILFLYSLTELVENSSSVEYVDAFISSLDYIDMNIKEEVLCNHKLTYKPELRSCCIAEQIIGSKNISVRSGWLFRSYDIGAFKQYELLKAKAIKFLDFNSKDEEIILRRNRDMQKLKEIIDAIES